MRIEASIRDYQKRSYAYVAVWLAAGGVGLCAVGYAKLIGVVQSFYFKNFETHPYWVAAAGPFLFLGAAGLVQKFAPAAKGSGIPQVLEVIEVAELSPDRAWSSSLVSFKTALIKVLSMLLGILGGASIGREGPTIQIAASGFAWIGRRLSKVVPEIDPRTFLTAGAAAGVAAAFNTPLAGISFAIEEIAEHSFAQFKQTVLISVVVAGITSQALSGDYLYFGHPIIQSIGFAMMLPQIVMIGIISGGLGGIFSKLISQITLVRLPSHWVKKALCCGAISSVIILVTHGSSAGSGYEVTQRAMSTTVYPSLIFPMLKFIATVISYLSGMAGGIFSPCLSIGASVGLTVARLFQFTDMKVCALLGMVAFFTGAVGAPLTAVIIVMEMTDEHHLIIPFMVVAFIAQGVGKKLMPLPLYRYLAMKNKSA